MVPIGTFIFYSVYFGSDLTECMFSEKSTNKQTDRRYGLKFKAIPCSKRSEVPTFLFLILLSSGIVYDGVPDLEMECSLP